MVGREIKVNFLVIGAARSATTSISNILGSHPDICFSNPKEPQFFSKSNWNQHLDEYHNLFKEEAKLYGEGSTNYSKFPSFNKNIHSDIFEYNPKMKLIYIMRHPIDRMVSHYKFALERGYAESTIEDDLINNPIYLDTSKYYSQIMPYLEQFGQDHIKFVFFEEFAKNPNTIIDDIFQFLGLSSFNFPSKLVHTNKSLVGEIHHKKYDNPKTILQKITKVLYVLNKRVFKKTPKRVYTLSEATRKSLLEKLRSDTENLESLLKKDLSHWKV